MSQFYYPPPVTGREPVFSVRAQQHNLLAGWWGLISMLIWNPIALISNSRARRSLRQQAARGGVSPADGRMAPPGR